MPTHQEIGGMSDEDLLQRMVTSHAERYGEAFWAFFDAEVGKRLPPRPVVMDLGCGPGLAESAKFEAEQPTKSTD